MRKSLFVSLAVSLLFLGNAYGQERAEGGQLCVDPGQTRVTHRFRYEGETIEIPLRGDSVPASVADCDPVALQLHWSNGRNNGSNFSLTFLDGNNMPIFSKGITAFLSGVLHFPLSSIDTQPAYGNSLVMVDVPATVTIQAVRPFAPPANLSYTVTRVARKTVADRRSRPQETDSKQGNEIVRIHNAVRLIGGSRLPVVQIELKTSRPFPVRDVPLQLQIGKKVFVDELSGDYTGRKLTLSLTPEMFAELNDGDEIAAFFGQPDQTGRAPGDIWHFGKLVKTEKRNSDE
jgi:hypothetical protein